MSFYVRTIADTPHFTNIQSGFKNPGNHNSPTGYFRTSNRVKGELFYNAQSIDARSDAERSKAGIATEVTNALHLRFVRQLGETSSFGATLTAELNETIGLVGGTVLRLAKAARAIKKLRFAEAGRILGLPYLEKTVTKRRTILKATDGTLLKRPRHIITRTRVMVMPNGREVQKTLANGWLYYSYGVSPLVSDIFSAIDVIQKPLHYEQKFRATASSNGKLFEFYNAPGVTPTIIRSSAKVRGVCGATISVNNPNLYVANQLGLTNPVQWINEAIPFSFVVDWFSNLSQVISSMTDYQGLTVKNPWASMHFYTNGSFTLTGPGGFVSEYTAFVMTRSTTLPEPVFKIAYERFQPQRALNAISLLIGLLPRK